MKKKIISLVVLIAVSLVLAIYLCRQNRASEVSNAGAPFNSIAQPIRWAVGYVAPDSDSIWVLVEDANKVRYDFVFRFEGHKDAHPTASYNYTEAYDPGALPLKNPLISRLIALDWLRKSTEGDFDTELLNVYKGSDITEKDTKLAYDSLLGKNEPILQRIQRYGICDLF
jgi:hypothetical protein